MSLMSKEILEDKLDVIHTSTKSVLKMNNSPNKNSGKRSNKCDGDMDKENREEIKDRGTLKTEIGIMEDKLKELGESEQCAKEQMNIRLRVLGEARNAVDKYETQIESARVKLRRENGTVEDMASRPRISISKIELVNTTRRLSKAKESLQKAEIEYNEGKTIYFKKKRDAVKMRNDLDTLYSSYEKIYGRTPPRNKKKLPVIDDTKYFDHNDKVFFRIMENDEEYLNE